MGQQGDISRKHLWQGWWVPSLFTGPGSSWIHCLWISTYLLHIPAGSSGNDQRPKVRGQLSDTVSAMRQSMDGADQSCLHLLSVLLGTRGTNG